MPKLKATISSTQIKAGHYYVGGKVLQTEARQQKKKKKNYISERNAMRRQAAVGEDGTDVYTA